MRAAYFPPGRPQSATPSASAASTRPIRPAEPVVESTNHGSASQVIIDPVVETTSAASRAVSPRFRSIATRERS